MYTFIQEYNSQVPERPYQIFIMHFPTSLMPRSFLSLVVFIQFTWVIKHTEALVFLPVTQLPKTLIISSLQSRKSVLRVGTDQNNKPGLKSPNLSSRLEFIVTAARLRIFPTKSLRCLAYPDDDCCRRDVPNAEPRTFARLN